MGLAQVIAPEIILAACTSLILMVMTEKLMFLITQLCATKSKCDQRLRCNSL